MGLGSGRHGNAEVRYSGPDGVMFDVSQTAGSAPTAAARRNPKRSDEKGRSTHGQNADGVVKDLFRYPVKSMLGERLDGLDISPTGVVGDRAYALREANGRVMTAKKWARPVRVLGPL